MALYLSSRNNFPRNCVLFYRQVIRLMMDYVYTDWRSHELCTHSLEIRCTKHTQPGVQMDYAHSLEIRWTKHTQAGDQIDYAHTAWRSDELSKHILEIRWAVHTAWRTDELSTHGLRVRWNTHTQPGDQMDYAHTVWRLDGQCTHGLEIRWTKHAQPGDPMD